MSDEPKKPAGPLDWLGISRLPRWDRARPLGHVLGVLLMLVALAIIVGGLATLYQFMAVVLQGRADHEAIRNIGLVLVAVFGAPFVLWRALIAQQQVRLSGELLFNEKINAAVEELGARRQVTRAEEQGGKTVILTEWEDDLVRRNGAIDRLEGLVRENPAAANRVSRLLSVYVRELSSEKDHAPKDHLRQAFQLLTEYRRFKPAEALAKIKAAEDDVSLDALVEWANSLKPARTDMEKAVQTLGRLLDIPGVNAADVTIDLRGANLQGVDVERGNYTGANLAIARMEGAYLRGTRMEGADLLYARMEAADLRGVTFDAKTYLKGCNATGAALRSIDFSNVYVPEDFLTAAFGDGSVIGLPEGLVPGEGKLAHWAREVLDGEEFIHRWRAWQAEIGYEPPD